MLADVNPSTTNEAVQDIVASGGGALLSHTHVGNWNQVVQMVETAVQTFGSVNVPVNNATLQIPNRLAHIEPEEWEE